MSKETALCTLVWVAFFLFFVLVVITGEQRRKCEKDLPRDKRCIHVWVPES